MQTSAFNRLPRRPAVLAGLFAVMVSCASVASAQVIADVPAGIAPAWTKGIQAISPESYYNAIACGKQGGANPKCVFWDTGLCKNDDFELAFYTPYKQVAYEVWQAVSHKQPAPTPNYQAAQRTRVTIGVKPVSGSKNPISTVLIRRGETQVKPATQSLDEGGGRFIFDYAAFAPISGVTLELVGKTRTISCTVSQEVLSRFR